MAKFKLLAGLVLGGAAAAAYHALDLEKREALKDAARDRYNEFKDRAVDYAFYTADALDEFKEDLNDRLANKDAPVDRPTATDDDASADEDDIVLNSDEVADIQTPDAPVTSAVSEETTPVAPAGSAEESTSAAAAQTDQAPDTPQA